MNKDRCEPPLDRDEVLNIAKSIERYSPTSAWLLPQFPDLSWVRDDELEERSARPDLVQGHLPQGCIAVMYGSSAEGKTFLAIDMAMAVAACEPWHGFATIGGPVAYVAAEGAGGLPERVAAWKKARRTSGCVGVRFLLTPLDLLDDRQVDNFIMDLKGWEEPPKLVVLDTLALCLARGEENSSKDMGRAVAVAVRLRNELGTAVLIVHHSGRNGRHERGHTVLRGAADTMIRVHKSENWITCECDKQRDGRKFDKLVFVLRPVGNSCVLQLRVQASGRVRQSAVVTLRALMALPNDAYGVTFSDWEQEAQQTHSTFTRNVKHLCELAYVRKANRRYRLLPAASRVLHPDDNSDPRHG
jgi:hypothetical protein